MDTPQAFLQPSDGQITKMFTPNSVQYDLDSSFSLAHVNKDVGVKLTGVNEQEAGLKTTRFIFLHREFIHGGPKLSWEALCELALDKMV